MHFTNQEAVVSFALEGSTPYRDVYVAAADSHLFVNGIQQNVSAVEANQIATCSNSGSYVVLDTPIWYSNAINQVASTFTGYKTKWNPSYRPADAGQQNSEMREPVGLSKMMLYYNRCTPYRKKFRITFTPCQTNRLRAVNTTDTLQGMVLAGYNANDDNDAPLMLKNEGGNTNSQMSFGQPKQKFLIGGFEKSTAQYAGRTPFWIENKQYPIPISESAEGFKIGLFEFNGKNAKPIVWEYTTSIESTYGKKVDMAEVYYTNTGATWAGNNNYPTYVNFFIYTLENSPDCGFIPYIQGHFRIESWVDCLFWDRKSVQVAYNLSTDEAAPAPTSIADDTEVLELETED